MVKVISYRLDAYMSFRCRVLGAVKRENGQMPLQPPLL